MSMHPMSDPTIQVIALAIFVLALGHTFAAKQLERLSHRFPRHAGLFQLLGEIEVVFGFWAIILILVMALIRGGDQALGDAESRRYTEPLFVFVVMVIAASRPVLRTVVWAVDHVARRVPLPTPVASAWLGLAAVPMLGSLITERAAMTIAALMLAPQIFRAQVPEPPEWLALGVLFVNISIGGTLTSYAAPPVLMVAATGQWDSAFMFFNFGWKASSRRPCWWRSSKNSRLRVSLWTNPGPVPSASSWLCSAAWQPQLMQDLGGFCRVSLTAATELKRERQLLASHGT